MKLRIKGIALSLAFLSSFTANSEPVDDRILHTGVSIIIGSGTIVATGSRPIAYSVCAVAGLGKEVYDEVDYGGFSAKDLAFDALGCVIGIEGTIKILGVSLRPSVSSNWMGIDLNYNF